MRETKLRSAIQRIVSFANDVWVAGGSAALGAAAGWLIFLAIASLNYGLPRSNDLRTFIPEVVLGLILGTIGGVILRSLVGKIQNRQAWALGFFAMGVVGGPAALIALIAYAISGTGGW